MANVKHQQTNNSFLFLFFTLYHESQAPRFCRAQFSFTPPFPFCHPLHYPLPRILFLSLFNSNKIKCYLSSSSLTFTSSFTLFLGLYTFFLGRARETTTLQLLSLTLRFSLHFFFSSHLDPRRLV